MLQPEGALGPAFLTPKNYFVIKEYNFSDLYVLFVGQLSDRIAGGRGFEQPWGKTSQLRTVAVEEMQTILTTRGLYASKIDGKAGMQTRSALGAYQKANRLPLDCWPSGAVLDHMRKPIKTKNPAMRAMPGFSYFRRFRSVADFDATGAIAVSVPITLPHDAASRLFIIGRGRRGIDRSRGVVRRRRGASRAADDGAGGETAEDADRDRSALAARMRGSRQSNCERDRRCRRGGQESFVHCGFLQ